LPTDDEDAPGAGPAQRDLVRDKVAQDVLARQKSIGDVPAGLARWAEELLHPSVDWRSVLAGMVRSALASTSGRRDFSYRVPSRRAEGLRPALGGAILPAMRQPPPPNVAAVLDTSGSISGEELRSFLSEILHIVRSVGVSGGVTTIPCDARAYEPIRIRRQAEALGAQFPGGGGTNMGAGLEAACTLRPRPDVVVVFTDGYTPWPAGPPHPATHFVVAISGQDGVTPPSTPGWLQRLVVDVR
jgi:predicted metal-dependent peptidase